MTSLGAKPLTSGTQSGPTIGLTIRSVNKNSTENEKTNQNDESTQTVSADSNNPEKLVSFDNTDTRIRFAIKNFSGLGNSRMAPGGGGSGGAAPMLTGSEITPWKSAGASFSSGSASGGRPKRSAQYSQQGGNHQPDNRPDSIPDSTPPNNNGPQNNPESNSQPGITNQERIVNSNGQNYKLPKASDSVIQVDGNANNFMESTVKDLPTLVIFSGKEANGNYWCGPCKRQEGEVNDLPRTLGGKVNVVEVAASRSGSSLSNQYGIGSFPSYVLLDRNGQEINRGSFIDENIKDLSRKIANQNDQELIQKQIQNPPEQQKPPETETPQPQSPIQPESQTQTQNENSALSLKPEAKPEEKLDLLNQIVANNKYFSGSKYKEEIDKLIHFSCENDLCKTLSKEEKLINLANFKDKDMQKIIDDYNNRKK